MKSIYIAIVFLMATVPVILAPPSPILNKKGMHHSNICKASMLLKKGGKSGRCNHHSPKIQHI
ncbi:hypothetical protein HDF23_003144 [Mucilaginibacter lappiensis]|uniref:Uncharacterized protein n=1 Tax=Mucilaginibacter lappiensis TaxID=354630 RepID=A0ABR6PKU6_9SPHI|nr:hypothetical protein [Mucilaginibacter lappiensis]MBB6110388.1 hypothetical protein [Mucilaginibacter lappiensis]